MQYIITFFEGIITFISPCLLPLLPVYISYFAGGNNDRKQTLRRAFGFVLGFSLVFVLLGTLAGGLGKLVSSNQFYVNLVCGIIVIILGLNFMGILKIRFLNGIYKPQIEVKQTGFLASMLFGMVFSIGWTPCVGAFLGSALMMASQNGSVLKGTLMLMTYSLGLAIPFILSALLIDSIKDTFSFIKKHYNVVNTISGLFLVLIGVLMMMGKTAYLTGLLR